MSQESNRGRGRGGPFAGGHRGGLLGSTVRKIAGGIGLASESLSAYKENKTNKKQEAPIQPDQSLQTGANVVGTSGRAADENNDQIQQDDMTEMQWQYDDEVQTELLTTNEGISSPSNAPRTDEEIAAGFIRGHEQHHGAYTQDISRLELPVILAQRRPKDRSRGFVRAYAPMLGDVGIDQTMWLDFLNAFDQSTQASPWIKAINLANIPGLLVPIGPGIAISVAIDMTIKAAQSTQSKQRCNKFLDKMNKEFFNPKGLCCVVMTWRPDSGQSHEVVSIASTVASSMDSYSSGIANKFKSSSGKTYGDFALPEAAPLIFPPSNDHVLAEEATGLKQSLSKKKDFIDNYYDKRAQSEFTNDNPDNILNQQQKPQYSSRYADPNDPSNNGSLISLVSGGYVKPPRFLQGVGGRDRVAREGRGGRGGRGGRAGIDGDGARKGRGLVSTKPVSSARNFFLKQDILYLMVVNMPTEAEFNQAQDVLSST